MTNAKPLWHKPAKNKAAWLKRALWAIRKSETAGAKAWPGLAREFQAMAREAIAQARLITA